MDEKFLISYDKGCVSLCFPRNAGYWQLDHNTKFYSPDKPSLWKRFWVKLIFEINWINV